MENLHAHKRVPGFNEHKKEWLVIAITVFVSLFMAYGFWVCPKGCLQSNSLLDENDFYFQSEHAVRLLRSQGFEGGDQFSFVIPFKSESLKPDLEDLLWLHGEVEAVFPEYGVLSLANAVYYPPLGELGDPYIYEELLSSEAFDVSDWKSRVKADPGVYEILIGKDFDYAQVIVFLPYHYCAIEIRNRVASLLEERKVSTWEWFYKNDVTPSNERSRDVLVPGWPFGRGLIAAALYSDVLKYSTVGLILVVLILYPMLGSRRQAFYCWIMIVLGLFWVRGTIGLLDLAGFQLYGESVKERVYILLTFTAIIIQGTSFGIRKFDAFNHIQEGRVKDRWKQTRWFNGKIYIVTVIVTLNFLSLYQIETRGIMEMGILASIGIFYLVFMTIWLLPALQTLFGGEVTDRQRNILLRSIDFFLKKTTRGCFWLLTRLSPQKTFFISMFFILIVISGALWVVWHDYQAHTGGKKPLITIGTKPIDYLPGTIVYRAREFLNQPGRYGFGKLTFLIRPKDGNIYDIEFIRQVDAIQREAGSIPGVRTSKSAVDTIKVISERQYGTTFPTNERQLLDILTTMDWDLGSRISSQLWYENGINLILSLPADESIQVERQSGDLISYVQREFPDLEILPFGRLQFWHRTDKYISEKVPMNVFTSFWIIIICSAVWIIIRTRGMDNTHRLLSMPGWRAGGAMVVPFVFGSSCIIYLMAATGIPLDQATACIMALAVNASIDFNLHLVDDFNGSLSRGSSYRQALHYAICEKGAINIVDVVVNAFCFSMLIFSYFIPVFRLGTLLVVMMFACGFGAIVLMPALFYHCVKPYKQVHYQKRAA